MDGVTFMLKRKDVDRYLEICKEWEAWSMMKLEHAQYKKCIQRDINNYIWIPIDYNESNFDCNDKNEIKKIKFKGFFEIEKEWHKNHSMKIVQKALANYFIKRIPVEKTIREHNNIFDFCKMAKAKSNFKLEVWKWDKNGNKNIENLHRITRYIVSNNGGQLMKVMPPVKTVADTHTAKFKKTHPQQTDMFDLIDDVLVISDRDSNLEAGYLCTIHNRIDTTRPLSDYDINYDYYINECYKVITAIDKNIRFDIEDDDSQLEFFNTDYD